MNSKDTMNRLYELLDNEIQKIVSKNDITPVELERAEKAICIMHKIEEMSSMDGGYSETSSYDYSSNNMSGRRGRSPMTGRYVSRDGHSMRSNGYSGHSIKDRAISRIEQMMDEAGSDYEREELSSIIRNIESGK